MATGDEWRLVNIQKYPNEAGSKPKSYVGHSEFVTRVAWSVHDKHLFTIGGGDKTLIKWRVC